VPDNTLLLDLFDARTVRVLAGMELHVIHFGLWLLSWPVRWRWLPKLLPFAQPGQVMANLLRPFGTNTGGMVVEVAGRDDEGQHNLCLWTLEA
tara:strand:+ start:594 stop:872 length:279 start_codon:yes stop_codon:yes gene_type:complete